MIRALAVLSVLAGAIAMPVQAAPRPATIGTAATVDFRVVLTARRTSAGDAPTAAVTATIYRLGRDSWERTGSRAVPGTYFWNVVSGRNAVCELSIATAGVLVCACNCDGGPLRASASATAATLEYNARVILIA